MRNTTLAPAAAILMLLAVALAGVRAQTNRPAAPSTAITSLLQAAEQQGMSGPRLAEAAALLDDFVGARKIAGAVAIVARHGKVVLSHAAGVQDLASRAPMQPDSLFRIYSMTKSVTSVAAMQLIEQGKAALDDPVSRYIPDVGNVRVATADGTRPPARPVTVRDLMLHTSGFNHRTSREYQRAQVRARTMTLPQFIANMVAVPLMEDPGTRYRYSEGTSILGRLVEIWSGQPLDVYFDAHIFRPLGMRDTGFFANGAQRSRLTTVYAAREDGSLAPIETESTPFTEKPALLEGAVGLLSTAPDYFRFTQMLLNRGELAGRRVLSSNAVDQLTRNGLSEEILRARGGAMGWGLGNVNVVMDPARVNYPSSRGEYGWDGTAGTIFWVDPGRELITILMTQIQPTNPDGIRPKFKTLVERAVVN